MAEKLMGFIVFKNYFLYNKNALYKYEKKEITVYLAVR